MVQQQQKQAQPAKPDPKVILRQQVDEFKKERAALRIKLDAYQRDFQQLHNRKIKYRQDIKPVQDEFKRYKDLKEEIAEME